MRRILIIIVIVVLSRAGFCFENALIENSHELTLGIVGGYYDDKHFVDGIGGTYRGAIPFFDLFTIGAHGVLGYNLVTTNLLYGGGLDFKIQVIEIAPIYISALLYGSIVMNDRLSILGGGATALITFDVKYFFLTLSGGLTMDIFQYPNTTNSIFLISGNYGGNIIIPLNDIFDITIGGEISADKLNLGASINFDPTPLFEVKTNKKEKKEVMTFAFNYRL